MASSEKAAAMILPAQEIRRRCALSPPMISPFVERGVVRGMSFGLSAASYDVRIAENVTIDPGAFVVLASTMVVGAARAGGAEHNL